MKRRNFLGFLGGAAVAGPGMVKEAAAKVTSDLALGQGLSGLNYVGGSPLPSYGVVAQSGMIDQIIRAKTMLDKLAGMTAEQRAKHKARLHVGALDPDLASYHSLSIGARMDMQRERQLDRMINERRGMFEILATGGDPYQDDPL
jgi:hypothetical protein